MLRNYSFILLILLAPVMAVADEAGANDEAEIREAVKRLYLTACTGSHEDIAKDFIGTPEELVSIKIFNGFCKTSLRYVSSCKKRWPNDNVPESADAGETAEKLLSLIGKPRIVGGNQASFDATNAPTLCKVDGKWKVASLKPASQWESLDVTLFAAQKAMGSIIGEIESGKFGSYAEMKVEQDKRVDQVVDEIKAKYDEAREKAKSSGFVGTFTTGKVTIEIHRAKDNTYAGTMTIAGSPFELLARESDGCLSISVKRGTDWLAYTAYLHDGNRLFVSLPDGDSPSTAGRKIPRPNLLEK